MALTPNEPKTDAEKRAERDAMQQDVLLREVDELVRQDQALEAMQQYGKPLIAIVIAGLAAFGGYLWWDSQNEAALELQSEEIVRALDHLDAGNLDSAASAFAELEDAGDGAGTVAKLARASLALQQEKPDEAATLYAEVAADAGAPKPYRDLATIREIAIRYDSMNPADVVTRLKPIAEPGSAYFGSAGELLGAAYLDQGREDLAGPLFAEIAKDKSVPEGIKSRVRELAGTMGVDAIEDVDQTLEEIGVDESGAAPQ